MSFLASQIKGYYGQDFGRHFVSVSSVVQLWSDENFSLFMWNMMDSYKICLESIRNFKFILLIVGHLKVRFCFYIEKGRLLGHLAIVWI